MSEIESQQRTPGLMSGKGPVIILTIIFSCTSFTLGYFVGKLGPVNRPSGPVQTTEVSSVQPVPQPQAGNSIPEKTQETLPDSSGQAPGGALTEAQRPSTTAVEVKSPEPSTEPTVKNPNAGTPEYAQTDKLVSAAKGSDEGVYYTVQLGAFKNRKEAERIKAKYFKKGYKMYIKVVKADHKTKIYKVRSGEFQDRKEAEALSRKLKNNGELKVFVTPANE